MDTRHEWASLRSYIGSLEMWWKTAMSVVLDRRAVGWRRVGEERTLGTSWQVRGSIRTRSWAIKARRRSPWGTVQKPRLSYYRTNTCHGPNQPVTDEGNGASAYSRDDQTFSCHSFTLLQTTVVLRDSSGLAAKFQNSKFMFTNYDPSGLGRSSERNRSVAKIV